MKIYNRLKLLLVVLIFFTLTASNALCQGTTSGPAGNYAIGDASEIKFGQSVHESITKAGESDYYKFHIDNSGIAHVKVENAPKDMITVVYLHNKNGGDPIANMAANNPGDSVNLTRDILGPGWYYVSVYDRASKEYNQPYTLTLSFDSAPDPYEPNNGFGDAAGINFNQSIQAYICPHEDTDYYKINITSPEVLSIKVQNVPPEMVSVVYLYGINGGDPIADMAANNPGDSVTLEKGVSDTGTYYIQVYDRAGKAYSQPYTLTVAMKASG